MLFFVMTFCLDEARVTQRNPYSQTHGDCIKVINSVVSQYMIYKFVYLQCPFLQMKQKTMNQLI